MMNAAEEYRRQQVLNAPPEQLTLMLYNGCLKFMDEGISAIDSKKHEDANTLLQKAQRIISEFRLNLNMEYEISQQLLPLYNYIFDNLVEGDVKKDTPKLIEAKEMIKELRDSWGVAIKKTNRKKAKEKDNSSKFKLPKIKLPAKFDFNALLQKYDAAEINQSPVKFYKAVIGATDEILNYLQQYGAAAEISIPFDAKYIDSPHLTPEENSLLKNRREKLAQILNLGVEGLAAQILEIRNESEEMAAYRERIMSGSKILSELCQFEKEPRVSFNFLVENIAESATLAQDKIIFFAENKNFIEQILDAQEIWSADYISFKQNLHRKLKNLCSIKNKIRQNIYKARLEELRKLRLAIEEKFLPLIEFALKGKINFNSALKSLEILNEYKSAVDKFSCSEENIQKKFDDFTENLRKFDEKFSDDLQGIIDACPKYNEQIFLKKWAESLAE